MQLEEILIQYIVTESRSLVATNQGWGKFFVQSHKWTFLDDKNIALLDSGDDYMDV